VKVLQIQVSENTIFTREKEIKHTIKFRTNVNYYSIKEIEIMNFLLITQNYLLVVSPLYQTKFLRVEY